MTSVISKMEDPCPINSDCFEENVFNSSTLYVPSGTIAKYKSTDYWSKFFHIEEGIPSGMNTINRSENETSYEVERYDAIGNRRDVPQKGLNIVKYSDGTVKKIFVR